jgi:hypothetical protein
MTWIGDTVGKSMSGPAVSSEHWKRRVTSREEGVDVERERFLGGTAMGVGGERLPPTAAARTGLHSSTMTSHSLKAELAERAGLVFVYQLQCANFLSKHNIQSSA